MSLDSGYKVSVTITVSKARSFDSIVIAKKALEEETIIVDEKTSAKTLNRKITELVSDAKQAVADMLYAIEENNKKEE